METAVTHRIGVNTWYICHKQNKLLGTRLSLHPSDTERWLKTRHHTTGWSLRRNLHHFTKRANNEREIERWRWSRRSRRKEQGGGLVYPCRQFKLPNKIWAEPQPRKLAFLHFPDNRKLKEKKKNNIAIVKKQKTKNNPQQHQNYSAKFFFHSPSNTN